MSLVIEDLEETMQLMVKLNDVERLHLFYLMNRIAEAEGKLEGIIEALKLVKVKNESQEHGTTRINY